MYESAKYACKYDDDKKFIKYAGIKGISDQKEYISTIRNKIIEFLTKYSKDKNTGKYKTKKKFLEGLKQASKSKK